MINTREQEVATVLPFLCFGLSPGFYLSPCLPMVLDLNRPLIPLQTNTSCSDQRHTTGARRRSVYRTVEGSTPSPTLPPPFQDSLISKSCSSGIQSLETSAESETKANTNPNGCSYLKPPPGARRAPFPRLLQTLHAASMLLCCVLSVK